MEFDAHFFRKTPYHFGQPVMVFHWKPKRDALCGSDRAFASQ
jgi:hypothetical protein